MAGLSADNPLRNVFNPQNVEALANRLKQAWPAFDKAQFILSCLEAWQELSFSHRSKRICATLEAQLPKDFESAARLLIDCLGPELANDALASLDSFIVMPQCLFITRNGHNHFGLSLEALYQMTKRFSAEGDLRVLLGWNYQVCMAALDRWTQDPNAHVRRLVSEGTRPRLPLAARIQKFVDDPLPVLGLLEKLKADPSLYVRRSVANNLNDIAKDHPDLACATLVRWAAEASSDTQWLVRHAARTLIKRGHPSALILMGFSPQSSFVASDLSLSPSTVAIGDSATISMKLSNIDDHDARYSIDYQIVKASETSRTTVDKAKVFKGKALSLHMADSTVFVKAHSFRNTAGRRYKEGNYSLRVLVNGKLAAQCLVSLVSAVILGQT